MKEKTCCFTGHRELPYADMENIKSRLEVEIMKLISQGVIYFGAGGAQGFDTLAAEMVLRLRETYPQIKLILVLPCADQARRWSRAASERYECIKSQADKVRILSEKYYQGCMHDRNRYLVDNAAYCICYLVKNTGGTAYTVNYARSCGLSVIEL